MLIEINFFTVEKVITIVIISKIIYGNNNQQSINGFNLNIHI